MASSKALNIDLGAQRTLLERRLKSGQYQDVNDVMRHALRALEREDAALDELLRAEVGPRWRISGRAFRPRMSSGGSRRGMRARRKPPSVVHKVFFRRRAEDRLTELYDYIAGQSSPQTAIDYVARIRMACMELATFPERGRRRDDILPGLRVIGFERR